jgi:hypothetical protein
MNAEGGKDEDGYKNGHNEQHGEDGYKEMKAQRTKETTSRN